MGPQVVVEEAKRREKKHEGQEGYAFGSAGLLLGSASSK
jgi:hypothetical protein